jgi:hypothetical protein
VALANVVSSLTAPAAGLCPSIPSDPPLSTVTFDPSSAISARTLERKLLVPAALAMHQRKLDRDLSRGEHARLRVLPAQLFKTAEQVRGRILVRPIVAAVVDDVKARARSCSLDRNVA